MGTPTPPTSPGFPTPGSNDISAGAKLDIYDIVPILMGAVPLVPELPAAAVDVVQFAACPTGVRRVVVRGHGSGSATGGLTQWWLNYPDGRRTILDGPANDYDQSALVGNSCASLRPVTLSEGQFLSCEDFMASGGWIDAGIGYVDVAFR